MGMHNNPLTPKPILDVEDADYAALQWSCKKRFYHVRWFKFEDGTRKLLRLCRLVLERKLGRKLLPGKVCDHIDCNPVNNRRDNLRETTQKKNGENLRPRSRPRGVHFNKLAGKFEAYVHYEYKKHYFGLYDTEEEAAARAALERKNFGFLTNQPD